MDALQNLYKPNFFEAECAKRWDGAQPERYDYGTMYRIAKCVPIATGRHWMNISVQALPARFYTFDIFDENAAPVAQIETGSGDLLRYFTLVVTYVEQVIGGIVEPKIDAVYLELINAMIADGMLEITTY